MVCVEEVSDAVGDDAVVSGDAVVAFPSAEDSPVPGSPDTPLLLVPLAFVTVGVLPDVADAAPAMPLVSPGMASWESPVVD